MDPHDTHPTSFRQTIVTIFLTGMVVAFFLLLLVLISGGLFIYLVGVLLALGAFGALHYLLWGRLLAEQTAGESEEELLRLRALAANDDDAPDEKAGRQQ
jgi:ABC-type bacteriocin/lantibiotic exporter with double-glycine peptidase domain